MKHHQRIVPLRFGCGGGARGLPVPPVPNTFCSLPPRRLAVPEARNLRTGPSSSSSSSSLSSPLPRLSSTATLGHEEGHVLHLRHRSAPVGTSALAAWRRPLVFSMGRRFLATTSGSRGRKGVASTGSKPSATTDDHGLPRSPGPSDKPERQLGRATVYHYPLSRSSNGAIRLLEAVCSKGPEVIDIVAEPLTTAQVTRLMEALQITDPRDFMRVNDPLYRELGLDDSSLSSDALIQEIIKHPRLMKRPVVDFPYRENGVSKRKVLIAQPPQKLFTVILNETEEEALGMVQPRSTEVTEVTEAERWVREWHEREGEKLNRDDQGLEEIRRALHGPHENYDFPEETDEMTHEDFNTFIDSNYESEVGQRDVKVGKVTDEHLEEFFNDYGLVDDNITEDPQEVRKTARQVFEGEDDEDEEDAMMKAIIKEMALKSLQDEERKRRKARITSDDGDDNDEDDEEDDRLQPKRARAEQLEEELGEFIDRLIRAMPEGPPPPPPLKRRGHKHHLQRTAAPNQTQSSESVHHHQHDGEEERGPQHVRAKVTNKPSSSSASGEPSSS